MTLYLGSRVSLSIQCVGIRVCVCERAFSSCDIWTIEWHSRVSVVFPINFYVVFLCPLSVYPNFDLWLISIHCRICECAEENIMINWLASRDNVVCCPKSIERVTKLATNGRALVLEIRFSYWIKVDNSCNWMTLVCEKESRKGCLHSAHACVCVSVGRRGCAWTKEWGK